MNQWPPRSNVVCKDFDGKILAKSTRSRLDLADELANWHGTGEYTIEVSVNNEKWTTWKAQNVKKIEDHIIYDLNFDGYEVQIERISSPGRMLCSHAFKWKLNILEESCDDYEDEDACCDTAYAEGFAVGLADGYGRNESDSGDKNSSRKAKAKRFRAANGSATIEKIQSKIEKTFGLPCGSVRLVKPNSKVRTHDGTVKSLRTTWKNVTV